MASLLMSRAQYIVGRRISELCHLSMPIGLVSNFCSVKSESSTFFLVVQLLLI